MHEAGLEPDWLAGVSIGAIHAALIAGKRRGDRLPRLVILQMVYQAKAYDGQAKDHEFGPETMREHWQSGVEDTWRTLARPGWRNLPPEDPGIVTHDVHRE